MAKKFTKPEFVADFDITKINPKVTYKQFIEDLRNNKIVNFREGSTEKQRE